MPYKLLSIIGILVAISCLGVATTMYPGGFDWNKDYISTLLRSHAGAARNPAVVGLLLFCASVGLVFDRLARATEFSKRSSLVRIGGIGSMVYASLTFTPMHDLMVTISFGLFLAAVLALLRSLQASGHIGFFVGGCVCLAVLVASAAVYYTGIYVSILPWAQRVSFALFAIWLVALDRSFPRIRLPVSEPT
jgi:hypothetical protein